MFRSSVLIVLVWAGAAQAESRALDRAEMITMMAKNATCYATEEGDCYAAEFYRNIGKETVDIVYMVDNGGSFTIVQERATWRENQICVPDTAEGVIDAWTLAVSDRTLQFDLSNATQMSAADTIQLRAAYADRRAMSYCYGWITQDGSFGDMISNFQYGEDSGVWPMRFVPLAAGSIELH
ncbi:hypothetical protein L0666_05175 [Octadecabacter sp. CECT 8868]|uniref:hypothetical protein n=1 Tax=Octadecabacter algicola TaxID=2909342 RepID=UPI001F4414D4|nr:hypothetical protein [Octadecabacter algicola]MCF2904370.1 hypothetical protein [Octadecabacter algicola]